MILWRLAAAGLLAFGLAGSAQAQTPKLRIAVVVKIGGIPWFNAMEVGIKKAGQELGVEAWMIGPTDPDPAQQVRAVEDLIAQKVDVIAVVPNDAKALEPVFQRARDAGIKVITHESPDQRNHDWNVELTTAQGYGERHMEALGRAMGGQGKYILYVGSLTVPLHNIWADAAIEYQKKNFPNMQLIADRFGVAEKVDDSYRTAIDVMRANPDLRGILTFGSQGPIGAGRAIQERNRVGQVILVGGHSPGQGARLVKAGVITEGYIWNPTLAGEVIVRLAKLVAEGGRPTDGMEFPGLGPVSVNAETRNILGSKLEAINKETVDRLVGMGL